MTFIYFVYREGEGMGIYTLLDLLGVRGQFMRVGSLLNTIWVPCLNPGLG